VVRLARTEGGGLRGEVTLPEGLEGVLEWRGNETAVRSLNRASIRALTRVSSQEGDQIT
jgi:hypothetical protein